MHILPLPVTMKRSSTTIPGGRLQPRLLRRYLRVSRPSRSLHRANLLECRVIPDKMTIFSSALRCLVTGETFKKRGGEWRKKKKKERESLFAAFVDFNVSFNIEIQDERLIFRDTTDVPRGNNLEPVYIYTRMFETCRAAWISISTRSGEFPRSYRDSRCEILYSSA